MLPSDSSSGSGHSSCTRRRAALVSESALRLPKNGDHGGPCGLLPRRGILARAEESSPGCLFLEAHSSGLGSLQSPVSSSLLPLTLPLLLGFCLLCWRAPGAVSWVSGHTHRDDPRGGQGPWGHRNSTVLLWEDGRTFLLLGFSSGKGRGRVASREGRNPV